MRWDNYLVVVRSATFTAATPSAASGTATVSPNVSTSAFLCQQLCGKREQKNESQSFQPRCQVKFSPRHPLFSLFCLLFSFRVLHATNLVAMIEVEVARFTFGLCLSSLCVSPSFFLSLYLFPLYLAFAWLTHSCSSCKMGSCCC